ncbi:uncharacterized protein DNG_06249 [Cephalotrichum gorgonifer]|uniref:HET domain-containing protein n=1 Tax=Cephalotrichum gorgonifer TaxID=2041049 RepID=A0AAE8MZF3_9PEZI|nr:uncharacterized protein DNG_06249 [Cephalotrichum gorgonifer]
MRLLNVETLVVEEFHVRNTPSYAILSHTWGEEEVTLQDIWAGRASLLKGYTKILGCCKQARDDGFQYVWIDTCCIDKTSSTELAEAINSMFKWYRRSVVCYAYLEDLDAEAVRRDPAQLGKSRWFTRGWTLQELIAPRILVFYSAGWAEMGTRDTLVERISAVTGIEADLFFEGKLYEYSVSQRMSWAAKRETTRVEDGAYCLLGIFNVNMPLLYGEGKMAFIWLQEEIMRRSDDQSIFAWRVERNRQAGLLASSAASFADSGDVRVSDDETYRLPFSMTNTGIQITLPVVEAYDTDLPSFETMYTVGSSSPRITINPADCLLVALNCETKSGKTVALTLDREGGDITNENIPYRRINVDLGPLYLDPEFFKGRASLKTIIVQTRARDDAAQDPGSLTLWAHLRPTFFGIRRHARSEGGFDLIHAFGPVATEVSGAVTVSMLGGGHGGTAFGRGGAAFGVFVGETDAESCWELVTGSRAAVLALADRFRNKNDGLLSSYPEWRLPLDGAGERGSELEAFLEARGRPHGFSIVFGVEERTGRAYSDPAVETYLELTSRKESGAGQKGIGVKKKKPAGQELLTL